MTDAPKRIYPSVKEVGMMTNETTDNTARGVHGTSLLAYNLRRGHETKRRVYEAMQRLGHGAMVKDIAEYTGFTRQCAAKAMMAVKAGWRP